MTAPLISPSVLLSSSSQLKLVEARLGGQRLCGSKLRREASGAVTIKRLRLSPSTCKGANRDRTWLEADEAHIENDLSSIKGAGRIRLGLGSLTLEGSSFTLLPQQGLLLLSAVVLRSRDPVFRLTARRLRARVRLDENSDVPIIEQLELLGQVQGKVVVPWRGESRKFDLKAGRLIIAWDESTTHIQLAGMGHHPVELCSRDGLIEARSAQGRLSWSHDEIRFEGELEGNAWLSGAAALSPAERTQFHFTRARGFAITASSEQPLWWSGEADRCALDQFTMIEAACESRSLGPQLVFQDPGYADTRRVADVTRTS